MQSPGIGAVARDLWSILETVPGLGRSRGRALLTHFGGLQGVMRASVADLEQVAVSAQRSRETSMIVYTLAAERSMLDRFKHSTWIRIATIPRSSFFHMPYHWSITPPGCCSLRPASGAPGRLSRAPLSPDFAARRISRPVAGKLIVAVALVLLLASRCRRCSRFRRSGRAACLPSAIVVGREIAISALREWMAEIGAPQVAVSNVGKHKTILQIVGLSMMLYVESFPGFQRTRWAWF